MSRRAAKNCRAVIVTKDGKNYLAPWRATPQGAIGAAQRLAERKKLDAPRIDVTHMTKPAVSE